MNLAVFGRSHVLENSLQQTVLCAGFGGDVKKIQYRAIVERDVEQAASFSSPRVPIPELGFGKIQVHLVRSFSNWNVVSERPFAEAPQEPRVWNRLEKPAAGSVVRLAARVIRIWLPSPSLTIPKRNPVIASQKAVFPRDG